MGYDPTKPYGTPTPTAGPAPVPAPGQGQTAVGGSPSADDPTVLAVTKTAQKYYGTVVPGTSTLLESIPGAGTAGQRWSAPKTLGQMKSDLYDLGVSDADSLAALQVQLIKAGLLDPRAKNFSLGSVSPDDPTDKAYSRLLTESIDTGGDYQVLLGTLATNPKNTRGQRNYNIFQAQQTAATTAAAGGGALSSSTVSLTDPNMARELLRNALENRLGRDPKPEEISDFISGLHGSETANPSHSTETFGGNGLPKSSVSVSSPPNPSAAAAAFATGTQGRADEAGAQSEVGFMNVLQRLLGVNAMGT